MKGISTFLALAAVAASGAEAYWKGFNIGANNPDGSCKSQSDWEKDFTTQQGLPGGFSSARLYAASDCNTLANAVPAAIATKTTLLVGVWTEDNAHYQAEKAALLQAVGDHGHDWLIAVTVGSEDLYRGDTNAGALSSQINEIRDAMKGAGVSDVQVGHVDTWTAWVDPANTDVIKAVDFVATDGYPYFQNADINDGANVFWKSVNDVRNTVNNIAPGKWVWITESGWPVSGPNSGPSVPSIPNAQRYWSEVACDAFTQAHVFWYTLQDQGASPSFGVVGNDFKTIYDLNC